MGRDLALERAWRQRMRRYERSGLTIREFCQQEDLVDHQFSWWRAELKRRATAAKPGKQRRKPAKKRGRQAKKVSSGTFVPLQIEPSLRSPGVEIVLEQPPRIQVTSGFDPELLLDVIRVLESR